MSGLTLVSSSEEHTREIGRALGAAVRPGLTILLNGDLGAGKTVLTRGICAALGITGTRSPSFTLINEYRADGFIVAHADLYRLDSDGADAIGLDEYAGADDVLLIAEWPDRWRDPPADNVLRIDITAADSGERTLVFSACGEAAEKVIDNVALSANHLNNLSPSAGDTLKSVCRGGS